jgi:hypothetical protein
MPESKSLDELEKQLDALKKDLERREKQVADQNSYITKLESSRAQVSNAPQQPSVQATDPAVQQYIERKMRDDTIAEATVEIQKAFKKEEFDAVFPDLLAFLKVNMKKSNTTAPFVIDAFDLLYARALKNKEHAIHKIGKSGTPTETPNAQTNAQVINSVQQQTLKNTPPIISPKDGTPSGLPETSNQVRSTKDAFSALKSKFNGAGGNKFQ